MFNIFRRQTIQKRHIEIYLLEKIIKNFWHLIFREGTLEIKKLTNFRRHSVHILAELGPREINIRGKHLLTATICICLATAPIFVTSHNRKKI